MGRRYERLTPGQVFGRLTVLEEAPAPTEYTTYKGLWYRCRCQCGNEAVVRRASLVNGRTKSCGCLRREHARNTALEKLSHVRIAPGQVFGRLTVIRETEERDFKSIVYECRCQCGNIVHVRGSKLKNGKVKSCGCLLAEIRANFNKRKEVRE